jgi:DNA polymerase V
MIISKFFLFYFIMDKTTKKENRGGAREGAGRKGLGNTRRVSICLTDELVPVFKQLGGAKWLRCELERVAEPARTLCTDQILVPAMNPTHLSIPVYECGVQAGFPSPAESYVDKSLDLNEYLVSNPASTFFVYVTGDSMDLAGMDEGDLLVVDRSPEPKNGDIVIMSINNEFTVKRYMKDDKGLRLLPESSNPIYKPILPKDYDEWRFIGVVKYTIKSN